MAPINPRDADLVFESTTDTEAQVAEGLGLSAPEGEAPETPETPPEAPETPEVPAEAPEAPPAVARPGNSTGATVKVGAPRKPRAVKKATPAVDAAADALKQENADLKAKLAAASAAPTPPVQAPSAPSPSVPAVVAATPLKPADIPATHPELADIASRRTALGAKPEQDAFDDYEKFSDAKDEWIGKKAALDAEETFVRRQAVQAESAARAQAQQDFDRTVTTFQGRVATTRAQHPDHDAVIEATDSAMRAAGKKVLPHIVEALLTSENGGELRYHLAKNPAELDRIQAMSPAAALMALGKLETSLGASPAAPARTTPPARVTKAPPPQGTMLGNDPGTGKEPDLDDPNLSLAEYNRLRNQMDAQSGRSPVH